MNECKSEDYLSILKDLMKSPKPIVLVPEPNMFQPSLSGPKHNMAVNHGLEYFI